MGIWSVNLLDIFLHGRNYFLDFILSAINAGIYWKNASRLFMANGVIPADAWTLNHEAGHAVTPDQVATMVKGVVGYGEGMYGLETFFALYPLLDEWYSNGTPALNSMIFSWAAFEDTKLGAHVTGGMKYNPAHTSTVEFWYYSGAFINEVTVVVMQALYRPMDIVQWWPRTLRSAWQFYDSFFMPVV